MDKRAAKIATLAVGVALAVFACIAGLFLIFMWAIDNFKEYAALIVVVAVSAGLWGLIYSIESVDD